MKEFNLTPQGEQWLPLGARPGKESKPGQGELLLRWNFTRTKPIKTKAMVEAERVARHYELLARAPTKAQLKRIAEREWDSLPLQGELLFVYWFACADRCCVDRLRLYMRRRPDTAKLVIDTLTWQRPAVSAALSVTLLFACFIIDCFNAPALSWVWLLVAAAVYAWYCMDMFTYDPAGEAQRPDRRAIHPIHRPPAHHLTHDQHVTSLPPPNPRWSPLHLWPTDSKITLLGGANPDKVGVRSRSPTK